MKACHLLVLITLAAAGAVMLPLASALAAEAAPDYRAEAEAFVAKCLKDPNVWVINPPVDADPYGDASAEDRFKKFSDALRQGGGVLLLYPDAMPCELNPRTMERERLARLPSEPAEAPRPWSCRQWFPDGRPMVVEEFLGQNLVSGLYYDAKGNLLGRVDQGKGTAFEFSMGGQEIPKGGQGNPGGYIENVVATCQYSGGKRNGQYIQWFDFDKKLKMKQEVYRDGKKEGLALAWMQSGQLNILAHYKDGLQDGDEVFFKPDGSVSSSTRYENGKIIEGATGQYAPKPYQQPPWERPVRYTRPETRDWPVGTEEADPSGVVTVGRAGNDLWGVRPKTGEVLFSDNRGRTWTVAKADLGFKPVQIGVSNYSEVFVWGFLPTDTPEKGLPNRIVFSRDRGATWHTATAPVDYMLSLMVQGDFLAVGGKFLPKAGLKPGEDWFGLYNWMIATSLTPAGPGKRWTKMDPPFTGGDVGVVQTVQRPDAKGWLYVVREPGGAGDPGGYGVHYHGSLAELPKLMARCEAKPDVAFGPAGKTVEVREPGKPAVVLDVRTGKPPVEPAPR
ncbi:MAG: hypothetical protein NTX87_14270 [Planctomycetota bacterium]|nr:hypothetical protein [Planctomycetota bacterium]